jgi:sugar phosphate isomerase/epimerase
VKLGYNTNGFAHHGLEDALRVIAGLGYRGVALTLDVQHLDPFAPDHTAALDRTRELLEELDLVAVVETGARYLLDPWRKHQPTLLSQEAGERARRRDFLERAIAAAARLGAPCVSLWSGTAEHPDARDRLDDRLAAELLPLARRAAEAAVTLALEPEPGMHIEDLAGWERIRRLVDHPGLRLTLDVGHAHLTEADGAAAAVRRVGPWIANVHLEGMRRGVHDHLPPDQGDLDLAAVVRALADIGYEGPANLELSRHSHAAVETARRALAFFAPLGLP